MKRQVPPHSTTSSGEVAIKPSARAMDKSTPARRSKAQYPSAKAIERTVAAARAAGIEPHGLEVSRDGNIRILPATHTANDLFSKWESKL